MVNQVHNNESLILNKIYWFSIKGDGLIQLHELRDVLSACMEENGMKFSDDQLDELTLALYEDAAASADPQHLQNSNAVGLDYEQLRAQMAKQPGLLDNLSIR